MRGISSQLKMYSLNLALNLLVFLTFQINIDFVQNDDTLSPAKIVCYFSAWAVYREEPMAYDIEDIPVDMCTHIIYSFIGLDNKTFELRIIDPTYDLENKGFERFVGLKKKQPNLKAMVAIGL